MVMGAVKSIHIVVVILFNIIQYINSQDRCITAGGGVGVCGDIRKCPALFHFFQLVVNGEISEDESSLLKRSICGDGSTGAKVCCRVKQNVTFNAQGVKTTPRPVPASVAPAPINNGLRGSDLLENHTTCGKRGLNYRVVGGENTRLGEWPWMVIFRAQDSLGSRRWSCGGVLISSRYVLTAAHCFLGVQTLYARIGEHSLLSDPDCERTFDVCAPAPQDIEIEESILYDDYSGGCGHCHDIALIRLKTPAILYKNYVVPICLPLNPKAQLGFSVEEFSGLDAKVAGWGSTSRDSSNPRFADVLQMSHILITDSSYCQRLKTRLPDKRMAFCAGDDKGRDTCSGDSGGPLTLTNNVGTQSYVIGVTSLGPEVCGAKGTQGLYTNVYHYIPWILRTLRP